MTQGEDHPRTVVPGGVVVELVDGWDDRRVEQDD
jgi:hypothetical protein